MLIQTNTTLGLLLLIFSLVLLIRHIVFYKEQIFPWFNTECTGGCMETYFAGPPKSRDPELLALIKNEYIEPPPEDPDTTPMDIYRPVWRKLVDWYQVQEQLKDIWQHRAPGTFVEVGAVDGDFMSQTLYLEKNLSWSGLLIEPDPRSYELLRKRKRNTWTSPLCIDRLPPSTRRFWLRDLELDLPEHFIQLLMARSKLNDETLTGDEERGSVIDVKCVPLSSLLLATNMTNFDLLTIATGVDGDDVRISDVTRQKTFDIKTLLVHYPTGRLFDEPYPKIPGYILDMNHSTLLVKFYVKKNHCQLISKNDCKRLHYYDVKDACLKYFCFNHLTVYTSP